MTVDRKHIPQLQALWQQAFGDPQSFMDAFFATGFSPERCHYLCDGDRPVSALYWFDCNLGNRKLAYLYAVATDCAHQGKGLARRLLEQTHQILKAQGYAGVLLVPGEKSLFSYYEKLGYRTATTVREFICSKASTPVEITPVSAENYARLRRQYLPAGGVVQEGAALAFLQTQATFYAGKDFLLSASVQGDTLLAQEILGNSQAAPHILNALGIPQGKFRTQGLGRPFSMFLPLQNDCPAPAYFGLALD